MVCVCYFVCQKIRTLPLLLPGDIEEYSGPMTNEQEEEFESICSVQYLKAGEVSSRRACHPETIAKRPKL